MRLTNDAWGEHYDHRLVGRSLRQVTFRRLVGNYVNACLDHLRYVGAHWFQWQDQPLTGRPDGENYSIGLVSITDTPYPELVAAVQKTASTMYQRRSNQAISKQTEREGQK